MVSVEELQLQCLVDQLQAEKVEGLQEGRVVENRTGMRVVEKKTVMVELERKAVRQQQVANPEMGKQLPFDSYYRQVQSNKLGDSRITICKHP